MRHLTIAQGAPFALIRARKLRNTLANIRAYGPDSQVWQGEFRERVGAPWRPVVNAQGNPIAYKGEAFALNGAALQKPNRFDIAPGRYIKADGDSLGRIDRAFDNEERAPTLSPGEIDDFARLIVAALNAYAPAQEWLAARNGHGPLEGARE